MSCSYAPFTFFSSLDKFLYLFHAFSLKIYNNIQWLFPLHHHRGINMYNFLNHSPLTLEQISQCFLECTFFNTSSSYQSPHFADNDF